MNMMPPRFADFPDAVVGLVPTGFHRTDHRLHQPPVLTRHRGLGQQQLPDQLGDWAEDVKLHLAAGSIADPYRARTGVSSQFGNLGLSADLMAGDGIQRHQPLGGRCPVDHEEHPVEKGHCFCERAQFDERRCRHGGIPEPAVTIVPVADATEMLWQAGGGGSGDATGWCKAEPFQHQRTPTDHRPLPLGQMQSLSP